MRLILTGHIRFTDLFAGMGGLRTGFEIACKRKNISSECVFISEIKEHAIKILKQNYPDDCINGDITKIKSNDIPDFDFLLAGFPCQAFSSAGKRKGFEDTRGSLFFEVERLLKEKRPWGFVLENVEGLVTHDKKHKGDQIGSTMSVVLNSLKRLGYNVSWKVINAKFFGVPQDRKRVYIAGSLKASPELEYFNETASKLEDILETGVQGQSTAFTKKLLEHFSLNELEGKSIKDKRGGINNIHSWDIEIKGTVSKTQKKLLNVMLLERRKKKWAQEYGIDWMDGMPLTISQIRTFFDHPELGQMLDDLVKKKYLSLEHPKRKIGKNRIPDKSLPLGYNIVTGKMSFEINKIMDRKKIAPALVAMDMNGLFVIDNQCLRNLTLKEGLKLFGYPEDYKFNIDKKNGYDLLGNTVVVPVITEIALRVIDTYF